METQIPSVKFCGMQRREDILAANTLHPDYVGFVFAPKSRRCVTPDQVRRLKSLLSPEIRAVGVFVNEKPVIVASLLNQEIIDLAQLHGTEDEAYIAELRLLTDKPLIQAFVVRSKEDLAAAESSSADHILLDAGAGSGAAFDWTILTGFPRPYFLAGGLSADNVGRAVRTLHPFAVDVSSGIETEGIKDPEKMRRFMEQIQTASRP